MLNAKIKEAASDSFFLASILVALLFLAGLGQYLFMLPPPRAFTDEGSVALPGTPPAAKSSEALFGRSVSEPAHTTGLSGVSFYKINLKQAEGLSLIARQHGLDIGSLISVNAITDISKIKNNTEILIPSENGIFYTAKRFDTVEKIAERFDTPAKDIIRANKLNEKKLYTGRKLFIPGGRLSERETEAVMQHFFSYPVAGRLKTFFGPAANSLTGVNQYNEGITFSTMEKQPVYAAAKGVVTETGFHSSYGYYVIITHENNFQTFYGFLSRGTIKRGAKVDRETQIGTVGQSGITNGRSLHFSLFKNGKPVDPLAYLK
jgi:LysM repeat protein